MNLASGETSTTCYDAIVVGAGPAGSICAARLAQSGRRVLLLEKSQFPRDKVCGDCLNPSIWPILDRLNLRQRLLALPHVAVREVSYHGIRTGPLSFSMPGAPEVVVKRRDLDALLVGRARELGADFRDGTTVHQIAKDWSVETNRGRFSAPLLFAADGRNSTVGRLVGWLPISRRERTAIQCHCPRPTWHGDAVRMLFYRGGYGGTAPVSTEQMNLCLVAHSDDLADVRRWAQHEFELDNDVEWHAIAPLSRRDAHKVASGGLFLLGDAARVVEPFTGEGIYYAMRSGELAAEAVLGGHNAEVSYRRTHREMYRGRLWINRLSRLAGLNPRITSFVLRISRAWPTPLRVLTTKVLNHGARSADQGVRGRFGKTPNFQT